MDLKEMTVEQRQQQLIGEFEAIPEWEERYRLIIKKGKALEMDDSLKTDTYKVKGCQSQVWIHARLNDDNTIHYQADSDAIITKGLVALLLEVYNDRPPSEILNSNLDYIKKLGLDGHLSPSRANGLNSMIQQMFYYAKAFNVLLASAH